MTLREVASGVKRHEVKRCKAYAKLGEEVVNLGFITTIV